MREAALSPASTVPVPNPSRGGSDPSVLPQSWPGGFSPTPRIKAARPYRPDHVSCPRTSPALCRVPPPRRPAPAHAVPVDFTPRQRRRGSRQGRGARGCSSPAAAPMCKGSFGPALLLTLSRRKRIAALQGLVNVLLPGKGCFELIFFYLF